MIASIFFIAFLCPSAELLFYHVYERSLTKLYKATCSRASSGVVLSKKVKTRYEQPSNHLAGCRTHGGLPGPVRSPRPLIHPECDAPWYGDGPFRRSHSRSICHRLERRLCAFCIDRRNRAVHSLRIGPRPLPRACS